MLPLLPKILRQPLEEECVRNVVRPRNRTVKDLQYHRREHPVRMLIGKHILEGILSIPKASQGIVLFAHGSGSSRFSPRNNFVAHKLNQAGLATLLFDLLTSEEEVVDVFTRKHRFDIKLLTERLAAATHWVLSNPEAQKLNIGYFGSSTGAAAALMAAAQLQEKIGAVVSRGGRPDLAGTALKGVEAPTLLIVGGYDNTVITLNEEASQQLSCEKDLVVIEGATHLFEEPGTLEKVAETAADWFVKHLGGVE